MREFLIVVGIMLGIAGGLATSYHAFQDGLTKPNLAMLGEALVIFGGVFILIAVLLVT